MRAPPEAVRQSGAEAVRDRHGEEQLERNDAEARREGPVPGREGHDELGEGERHDRVQRDGADVDGDEHAGQDPEEAVDVLDREAGEAGHALLAREEDAGEHAGRDEQVGRDAAGAGRVPGRGRGD